MMLSLDKSAHALAGAAIAASVLPFGLIAAVVAVGVAAVGKEVWDLRGNGTPEHADALATVVGGALMINWLHIVAPVLA